MRVSHCNENLSTIVVDKFSLQDGLSRVSDYTLNVLNGVLMGLLRDRTGYCG